MGTTITDIMIRRVGRAAEDKVRAWANPNDMTAHPPAHDERAWDFIIEYDLPVNEPVSLDKSESIVTCKIQAKGTYANSKKSIQIELTNWNYMVKQPIPFFVVIVVFNEDDLDNPTAVFLVHIDKDYVEKVLKKLRGLTGDERRRLNEKTIVVNWSDENKLHPPYDLAIGKKIREYVGPSAEAYTMRKIGWLKQVGYDAFPLQGSISFHCPDGDKGKLYDQLADLGVGITNELRIEDIELNEFRFGISKPVELISASDAADLESISIALGPLPSLGTARITLNDLRNESMVTVACETYRASAVFKFLPKEKDKCRLVSPFISFVLEPPRDSRPSHGHIRFHVTIPDAATITVSDLNRATKALELLRQEQKNGLEITFDYSGLNRKGCDVMREANSVRIPLGPYIMEFPPRQESLLTLTRHVKVICSNFEIDDQTEVRLDELSKQAEQLSFMYNLLQGIIDETQGASISFINNSGKDVRVERAAVLVAVGVFIGKHLLIVVAAMAGNCEVIPSNAEDSRVNIHINQPKIHILAKRQILLRSKESYPLLPLLEVSRKELFDKGYDVIFDANAGTAWGKDPPDEGR